MDSETLVAQKTRSRYQAPGKKARRQNLESQVTTTRRDAEASRSRDRRPETMLADTVVRLARHLVKGNKVRIVGLGIFQVKKREARMGRNPQTGEPVKIKASKKVTFRAGRLGAPIQDSIIRLSELRKWDGKDPSAVLHFTGRLIFPINSIQGDKPFPQSSMTLVKQDGEWWTAVEFGSVAEAQSRARTEGRVLDSTPTGPGSEPPILFQVRFREMRLIFVAKQVDKALFFSSLEPVPSIGLEPGQIANARDVLLKLQPIAAKLVPGAPN